jgi:hypothetical protein
MTLYNNVTFAGTTTFTGATATFNGLILVIPAGGSVTLETNATFSSGAPSGTYQFSIVGLAGTNGQAVIPVGLPQNGARISIAMATATATPSFTSTLTPIFTATPTASSTATATPSSTSSSTPMPTRTPTSQNTPNGKPTVIIYPNPAPGDTVNILPPAFQGSQTVEVGVFTTNFRKILGESFTNVSAGQAVTLVLRDRWGVPLANGLYYVVVIVDGHRSVGKLLIIR